MATPVATASQAAWRARGVMPAVRRRIAHGRCSDRIPASSRATPRAAIGPSRSPRKTIPMATARTGAVPRAMG